MKNIERIVYVEDSDDEVFLARIVFKRARVAAELVHYDRFETLEREIVEGGPAALDACLMVLDLNLKLSKGTDAVRRLRELGVGTVGTIVGVCTGSEDPADRRDALDAGADFCVGKPLDVACLGRICEAVDALEMATGPDGTVSLALADRAA